MHIVGWKYRLNLNAEAMIFYVFVVVIVVNYKDILIYKLYHLRIHFYLILYPIHPYQSHHLPI